MKVLRPGLSAAETTLESIMTREPLTVSPEAPLERCMDLMMGRRIRHLPVTEQGHLIGMISIGDLMRHLLNQQSQQIDQLAKHLGTTT
jgi:CBS domain-containing protein